MEERPLNSSEDGQDEELSIEPAEKPSLFDSEFFSKWLDRVEHEKSDSEDEEEDDDDSEEAPTLKVRFRELFRSVFPKIVESEQTESRTLDIFEQEHDSDPGFDESEIRIDHTPERAQTESVDEYVPIPEVDELVEDEKEDLEKSESEEFEPEVPSDQEPIPPEVTAEPPEQAIFMRSREAELRPDDVSHEVVKEKEVVTKDNRNRAAWFAFLAAEFLSRRRDKKIKKELAKTKKEVREIKETKNPAKQEKTVVKEVPREIKVEKQEVVRAEKSKELIKPEEKNEKRVVTADRLEHQEETTKMELGQREIDFERRHEVMGGESDKPKAGNKEIIEKARNSDPVPIGDILASKVMPSPAFDADPQNTDLYVAPKRTTHTDATTSYRQSVQTGFMFALLVIVILVGVAMLRSL